MNTRLSDSIKGKQLRWMLAIALSLSLLSACTPGASEPASAVPTAPPARAAELAELVRGSADFSFDLSRASRTEQDGNSSYSPYSISLALVMIYAGARDETERQMADTLHFTLPQERLHLTFNALNQELGRRGYGGGDAIFGHTGGPGDGHRRSAFPVPHP